MAQQLKLSNDMSFCLELSNLPYSRDNACDLSTLCQGNMPFLKSQLFVQSHSVDLCTENCVLFFEESLHLGNALNIFVFMF